MRCGSPDRVLEGKTEIAARSVPRRVGGGSLRRVCAAPRQKKYAQKKGKPAVLRASPFFVRRGLLNRRRVSGGTRVWQKATLPGRSYVFGIAWIFFRGEFAEFLLVFRRVRVPHAVGRKAVSFFEFAVKIGAAVQADVHDDIFNGKVCCLQQRMRRIEADLVAVFGKSNAHIMPEHPGNVRNVVLKSGQYLQKLLL